MEFPALRKLVEVDPDDYFYIFRVILNLKSKCCLDQYSYKGL